MARIGVSYESVAAAANGLVSEGQKATLTAVRERLATGSMNTIHRHWTVWQGQQKPAQRKLSEPNSRLLSALGSELSKVAEEAASESEAALAQAMQELAIFSANGEALEAERDSLSEQLVQISTERDVLAGKAAEQAAEIARLNELLDRARLEVGDVRRLLAQAELRLEAVPRMEADLLNARSQVAAEAAARVAAEKAAAVAEAQRVAAQAAQQQAESRLGHSEERESEARKSLAEAMAAHLASREKLVDAVAAAAGAAAEIKALRAQQAEAAARPVDGGNAETSRKPDDGDRNPQRSARTRKPATS